MKIRINPPRPGLGQDGGVVVDPIDPLDPNELFELVVLTASTTDPVPFQPVEVTWRIQPARDDLDPADYVFSLVSPNGIAHARDIGRSGTHTLEFHATALVMVAVRHRGGGDLGRLRPNLQIRIDESGCTVRPIDALILDALVSAAVADLTAGSPELRLRGGKPVKATWTPGRVRYDLPLEVVINNFFNADLDVRLDLRFVVTHDGPDTELEVDVRHDSDLDFHWLEDVLSLGSSSVVAKTANRLIPIIMACESRHIERDVLRQLLAFLAGDLANLRLLAARVFGDDHSGGPRLEFILCPPPPPDGPGRVLTDVVVTDVVLDNG